ncbi:hypothetical protein D5086_014218 [Populus alba]|uniref:Uncharacterized protein n=1 Tax=Populus alba TaxID=43335 RepID=A0ACC4BXF7_POPAL
MVLLEIASSSPSILNRCEKEERRYETGRNKGDIIGFWGEVGSVEDVREHDQWPELKMKRKTGQVFGFITNRMMQDKAQVVVLGRLIGGGVVVLSA